MTIAIPFHLLRPLTYQAIPRRFCRDRWAAAGSVDTPLSFLRQLELYRADVAERRMPARRIVKAFDVIEHI